MKGDGATCKNRIRGVAKAQWEGELCLEGYINRVEMEKGSFSAKPSETKHLSGVTELSLQTHLP